MKFERLQDILLKGSANPNELHYNEAFHSFYIEEDYEGLRKLFDAYRFNFLTYGGYEDNKQNFELLKNNFYELSKNADSSYGLVRLINGFCICSLKDLKHHSDGKKDFILSLQKALLSFFGWFFNKKK